MCRSCLCRSLCRCFICNLLLFGFYVVVTICLQPPTTQTTLIELKEQQMTYKTYTPPPTKRKYFGFCWGFLCLIYVTYVVYVAACCLCCGGVGGWGCRCCLCRSFNICVVCSCVLLYVCKRHKQLNKQKYTDKNHDKINTQKLHNLNKVLKVVGGLWGFMFRVSVLCYMSLIFLYVIYVNVCVGVSLCNLLRLCYYMFGNI